MGRARSREGQDLDRYLVLAKADIINSRQAGLPIPAPAPDGTAAPLGARKSPDGQYNSRGRDAPRLDYPSGVQPTREEPTCYSKATRTVDVSALPRWLIFEIDHADLQTRYQPWAPSSHHTWPEPSCGLLDERGG